MTDYRKPGEVAVKPTLDSDVARALDVGEKVLVNNYGMTPEQAEKWRLDVIRELLSRA